MLSSRSSSRWLVNPLSEFRDFVLIFHWCFFSPILQNGHGLKVMSPLARYDCGYSITYVTFSVWDYDSLSLSLPHTHTAQNRKLLSTPMNETVKDSEGLYSPVRSFTYIETHFSFKQHKRTPLQACISGLRLRYNIIYRTSCYAYSCKSSCNPYVKLA